MTPFDEQDAGTLAALLRFTLGLDLICALAAAAVAAGSPPTTRPPLAPLDEHSAGKRSAPGQQGGSASELALLQLGTCEEPQLVDMIEALLVAHPELAPEVRQMLVER